METISHAQSDMRAGYANGSVGIIVSGFIWLISALVVFKFSDKYGIWTLLIGGMFIYPLSVVLAKILGQKGTHTEGNPLANLAMEGTIFMLMCLPLAFGLSLQHSEWFFQAMLLIIGGRYLTFASIYGNRLYWILGGILGISAYLLFGFGIKSLGSAMTGSLIEISFGLFMLITFRKAT
ncbi:hypothetical protein GBK04_01540 [Cytophagaceae bacterium SJW1-29]|uniref:DUF308 domain-containing protein n=1 Tax=Salmonirosea aquatica TaxID=2654236 RepID=A0A7C9B9M2_9BACT|nr:hypothetical protein [Cytophagaceae bacterium SJW1-29]